MRFIKYAAAACLSLILLSSCGKDVENYRIYNDLVPSFSSALSARTLKDENITKSDDGRQITAVSYTYKSKKASEDKENYLYYMLNNKEAAFIADDTVAYDSSDEGYAVVINVTSADDSFTINIIREER